MVRIETRWVGWLSVLVVAALVGCGGGEEVDPGPIPYTPEADAGVDAEPEEDAWDPADVEGDVDEEVGPEFPVDGEGDNCPEISNPDQADRDRDGVGDACDHWPYFYDPDNPEEVEIIQEVEGPPNSTFQEGRDDWRLELPFVLEGDVAVAGEMDFYSFDVSEPTNLLIHLEPLSGQEWMAAILVGDQGANEGLQEFMLSDGPGEEVVRDMPLPLPGRYILVIADFRNVSEAAGPVGGPGWGYRASVSTPPLPEGEPTNLPTPRKVLSYDGEPLVFSVDVEGLDGLRVQASGSPQNVNSVLYPAIQIRDRASGAMLAYTREEQVDSETLRSELNLKIGPEVETVDVVVHAHTTIGENNVIVDIVARDLSKDLETFEQPRNSRLDDLMWLMAGTELEGTIGPPRVTSDTSLAPDVDYFLIYGHPGQHLRVEVEPLEGSLMIPEVEMGRFFVYPGFDFYSVWHRGRGAVEIGDDGVLSALVTADRYGEVGIAVKHRGNQTVAPVGGPQYGYEIRVLDVGVEGDLIDSYPATVPVVLEPGLQGLYPLQTQGSTLYRVSYNGIFSRPVQLIDGETWEVLEESTSGFSFVAAQGREYLLGVRNSQGLAVAQSQGVVLEIEEVVIDADPVDLPFAEWGEFGAETASQWWTVSVEPGTQVAVNAVGEAAASLDVVVFETESFAPILEVVGAGVFETGAADEVMVSVSGPAGVVEGTTLGLAVVEVEGEVLDGETVEFAEGLIPRFFDVSTSEAGLLGIQAAGEGQEVVRADLYSPTLALLGGGDDLGLAAVARSTAQQGLAVLFPRQADAQQDWSATVSLLEIGASEAYVLGPEEGLVTDPLFVEEFPVVVRGEVSPEEMKRRLTMELEAGSRLWGLSIPAGTTTATTIDPDLDLFHPDGFLWDWAWYGGEGSFPYLPASQIPQTGLWAVEFGLYTTNSDPGEFVLFLLVQEPPE